ncbi:MAG: MOSC domain-containing protein [Verrucomicrobiota bacterium]
MKMNVKHLYISPGHNYFGHYGKASGTHRLMEQDSVECVAGLGIQGDRFFGYKENYQGQITFFSWEVFQALCDDLGVTGVEPGVVRRNVVTEGQDLNAWIGKEFEIQGVHFEGVCECSPCFWMDEAVGPGAEEFLKGQGGLRARILTDGELKAKGRR